MSVCVYPLPPDQQVSPGAKVALRALQPFNAPKLWRAPWDLNRNPNTFAGVTRSTWRPDMELPQDVQALAGDLGPGPARTTTGARAGAARGCLETLSFAYAIQTASGGFPTMDAVSTTAIPWPFQIVGFSVNIDPLGGTSTDAILQLFLTDSEYTTIRFDSPETRLIQPITNLGPSLGDIGLRISANDLSVQQQHATIAAQVVGNTVFDPGKRITLAALLANGGVTVVTGHLTVQRCDAAVQFSVETLRVTSRAPARPPAPAAPGAPAPAPAAAPAAPAGQYVSTGTCLKQVTSGGYPLEFWRQRGYTLPLCGAPQAISDAGPADNPAAATYWAEIMQARGDATRAAMFRDMANRMLRGYSLTPTQQTYLSSPTAYQATGRSLGVTAVSTIAPITTGLTF